MRDYSKGAIVYQAETVYGEAGAVTPAWRIPHLGELSVGGLKQAKLDPGRLVQYANECPRYILGPQEVAFTTRTYLPGRGSTADGSNSSLGTLLSYVIGIITRTGNADSAFAAGWNTTTGDIDLADGSLADGGVFWAGALGDGRGNGQPSVVATHASATVTAAVALQAAPADNDVFYVAENLHPPESPDHAAQAVTGIRVGLYTADQQYVAHGCFAQTIRLTGTGPNEQAVLEIDWGGSWFEEVDVTFPVSTATDEFEPLPNAAGSLFLQKKGTASRGAAPPVESGERTYRQLSVEIALGVVPQPGPGAVSLYARYADAPRRTGCVMTMTIVEDTESEATTESELRAMFEEDTSYHLMLGLTVGDNQRLAIRGPNVEFIDALERVNVNGISGMQYRLRFCTDTSAATELGKAAFIIALG